MKIESTVRIPEKGQKMNNGQIENTVQIPDKKKENKGQIESKVKTPEKKQKKNNGYGESLKKPIADIEQIQEKRGPRAALLIIDMQNDFFENEMEIDGAREIIPIINRLRDKKMFDIVVNCRDWHPKNHISFQSQHPGTEIFGSKKLANGLDQIMWPDHCIQGTYGAQFHKDLVIKKTDFEVTKGVHSDVDALSAFGGRRENTGLFQILQDHEIEQIYLVGLAFDYSLGYTAEDGALSRYETFIIKDATRSVDPFDDEFMSERLNNAGVNIITQNQL